MNYEVLPHNETLRNCFKKMYCFKKIKGRCRFIHLSSFLNSFVVFYCVEYFILQKYAFIQEIS